MDAKTPDDKTPDDALTRKSAVDLAALMRSRAVSPVEVLDAHLAAIARINPKLNAIVTLAAESARAAARRAEAAIMAGEPLGPLHGLPIGVKDVTHTAGIRTTFGSPLFKDFIPDEDAEVVRRLNAAGAIVLAKTNTPEFATGANTVNPVFGATRNPWNCALSPAGSSGGSAVAVATGMLPLAQGTDFGCSIRIPAAFCGIVGIRPTPGLTPNHPMPLAWDPGQVHGPLARSAEDAALMLDAIGRVQPALAHLGGAAMAERPRRRRPHSGRTRPADRLCARHRRHRRRRRDRHDLPRRRAAAARRRRQRRGNRLRRLRRPRPLPGAAPGWSARNSPT
jgi:Asp-tRNA(Asn)/Glu-tRNA(Gln) amidotransferase A subunit family amidase